MDLASKRVLNIDRLKGLGFNDFTDIDAAISEVIHWYHNNNIKRYDVFKEGHNGK